MLRRVENVQVFYKRDAWGVMTGKYRVLVQVGKKEHLSDYKVTPDEFRAMAARSTEDPVAYLKVADRTFWRFQDRWHTDNEGLDQEAVRALLVTRSMRRQDTVSRAKTVAAMTQAPVPSARGAIAADVRQLVWARAGGACQQCGSNSELQFDHVIPVAYGGSSTEDNLQILCGPCNRRKGASVG